MKLPIFDLFIYKNGNFKWFYLILLLTGGDGSLAITSDMISNGVKSYLQILGENPQRNNQLCLFTRCPTSNQPQTATLN